MDESNCQGPLGYGECLKRHPATAFTFVKDKKWSEVCDYWGVQVSSDVF